MNFSKSFFEPTPSYKIKKYPTSSGYEYAEFYKEQQKCYLGFFEETKMIRR